MDILSLTAVELAKAIREGKTTAVEATQAVLDRIAAGEDTYHCYVTVERDKALQQAAEVQKKIEAGELTGPLAGVPFAIKDNMCTEGTLTTCSSKILENFIPTFSAEAVLNLEKAGRSIYFNGNGGTGADVTWYYTDGDNFSFPTVSRRGYTLDGWLDQETGWMSNTGWLVCNNYTEIAQWTANSYNIYYDCLLYTSPSPRD